jgi:hypothetical protein
VRKIAQPHAPHNARARLAAAGLLLLLAATTGCQDTRPGTTTPAAHVARGCALVVDTSGLDAFWQAAEKLQAEPVLTAAAAGALIATDPVWRRWRESYEPDVVSPDQLGLVLRGAVLGTQSLAPDEATKLVRRDAARGQAFTLAQRARVQTFVDDFVAQEAACAVWPLARAWIRPEALPDTLHVDLLAAAAEIRLYEGHHLVDAGLALVSGREQLTRLLASVLYRKLEATAGPSPGEVAGEAVLAHSLRLVRNEGIAAYIDDLPNLFFGHEHPSLAGSAPVPEEVCATARLNLLNIERVVADQLSLPAAERDFAGVHITFVGSRGWQATGWFMAAVIADRQGEQQLQAVARSLPDFVAAYQVAALANPPDPGAAVGTLAYFLATAPAFSPPVLAALRSSVTALP